MTSALMTPIMVLAVMAVVLIALLARKRGAEIAPLIATVALALVAVLIAFNKVGSPQFISWLAVPLVLGLTTSRAGRRWWFAVPATLGLVIAALTQVIYPYLYGWLIGLYLPMVFALTARNILVFALVAWAVLTLWNLGREASDESMFASESDRDSVNSRSFWPIKSQP